MATTKGELLDCIKAAFPPDDPELVECYWRARDGAAWGPVIAGSVHDLPEREFDSGYGAIEGEQCIAFGPRYVYIKVQYDGAEWFEAIPRHPRYLEKGIPWPGG